MAYELEKLPYGYEALEPFMDAKTVEIHYSKHHQGYVNKLNAAVEKHPELFEKSVDELLKYLNAVPEDIRTAVRNNGGGHANHTLFWSIMKKDGGQPEGELADAINKSFGSYDSFKQKFSDVAKAHFASGWAWLVVSNGSLEVLSTPNHDTPLSMGKTPIITLDVWEHSYYLKHMWNRAAYVEDWLKLVNWKQVGDNYKEAMKK